MIEEHGDNIVTTDTHWDCNCKTHYIHRASTRICYRCKTLREDGPDSRLNEAWRSMTRLQKHEALLEINGRFRIVVVDDMVKLHDVLPSVRLV